MMKKCFIPSVIAGGVLVYGSSSATAQTFGVEYTCEWQTDFTGSYDWLNLLKATAEMPIYRGLKAEAATLSIAKTGADPLVEDLLTYSNIEAGNLPLTFSRLGLDLTAGDTELFAGINNVNEDYFTSELTSFFTGSSCGISPTISCNYDIANYPLAAWCLHYGQQIGAFRLQTSLYPGKGYYRLGGHRNLFSLDLKRDGIFSISSIDYERNGIYCTVGVALYHGVSMADEDREQMEAGRQATPQPRKRFSAAPWILSEIELPCSLGLLLHGSLSTVSEGCRWYAGAGLVYNGARVQPGVCFNHASFTGTHESTVELCARIPLFSGKCSLQPAFHLIATGQKGLSRGNLKCVGLFRFNMTI